MGIIGAGFAGLFLHDMVEGTQLISPVSKAFDEFYVKGATYIGLMSPIVNLLPLNQRKEEEVAAVEDIVEQRTVLPARERAPIVSEYRTRQQAAN